MCDACCVMMSVTHVSHIKIRLIKQIMFKLSHINDDLTRYKYDTQALIATNYHLTIILILLFLTISMIFQVKSTGWNMRLYCLWKKTIEPWRRPITY